jgi:hypothetical protein
MEAEKSQNFQLSLVGLKEVLVSAGGRQAYVRSKKMGGYNVVLSI